MGGKSEARKRALHARDSLPAAYRAEQSRRIVKRVLESELYQRAHVILSYCSFRSEVETACLNEEILRHGKRLYLPKTYCGEKCIRFYEVKEMGSLEKGYQGILEPDDKNSRELHLAKSGVAAGRILMVMPGAAFDAAGYRMGYGGGYYDRYLSRYGTFLTSLLIAFEEQRASLLYAEEHDVRPDFILTQEGFRKE